MFSFGQVYVETRSTPSFQHIFKYFEIFQDKYGEKVWICPACRGQDDGSPMIGCDDCDAWYHWSVSLRTCHLVICNFCNFMFRVCVGIQVPPDDNEDWYCRICIVKKQETLQMDKKKKRKKKDRKESH